MKGIVSLGCDSRDGAFYALELPPLVIKMLGVFDPIIHLCQQVRKSVDLFEDFRVYGSAEIVNCGLHIKSAFCCSD